MGMIRSYLLFGCENSLITRLHWWITAAAKQRVGGCVEGTGPRSSRKTPSPIPKLLSTASGSVLWGSLENRAPSTRREFNQDRDEELHARSSLFQNRVVYENEDPETAEEGNFQNPERSPTPSLRQSHDIRHVNTRSPSPTNVGNDDYDVYTPFQVSV